MRLEVVSETERLFEFAPEWCRFARTQPRVTPFQLPDWLIPWWRHFGSGSLRVLVFRKPECVGVVPCFLHEWNGARQLTLIGSGISDYLDPVLLVEYEQAILSCLNEYLSSSNEWDVCDWQDLVDDTPLNTLAGGSCDFDKREEVECSRTVLGGTFEQFWDERPRHLKRNVRRYAEKARQSGALDFEATRKANPKLLDSLIRLHAARWCSRGESGMIEANHSAEFLTDIAQQFAEKNMLRLFSLRYGGEIRAVILAFVYQEIAYGYLTGFEPAYGHLSLASVLLKEALRECYGDGLRAWDFCRGDEPYKQDWGAQPVRRCRLMLQRRRS